jgi:hypothetical protein
MGDDGRVAADKKRGTQTVRDMVLSLAVIVLAAGVVYLFIPHDPDRDPVKAVDYRVALSTARRAAPYPIVAPQGLPKEWRATSVTYDAHSDRGAAWHLGFLTGRDQYAAVEQSDARALPYIETVTQGAHRTDHDQTIDGERWVRWEGTKYDALVRRSDGWTTVVTGTAPFGKLTELAGALSDGGAKGDAGNRAEKGSENGAGRS